MLEEFTEPEQPDYPKPKPNGKPPRNMPEPVAQQTRERVVHNTPTDEDIESWGIQIRKG